MSILVYIKNMCNQIKNILKHSLQNKHDNKLDYTDNLLQDSYKEGPLQVLLYEEINLQEDYSFLI